MEPIIRARNLNRIYRLGSEEVHAVQEVSLDIMPGDFTAFVGPSGSGKTTLLNLLGCLENPTSGELVVAGKPVFNGKNSLSERKLTHIRREHYGYVFQKFHLIPTLTVRENIELPRTFFRKEGFSVAELLSLLGLESRAQHLPGQLSGGEMQRVAVARALINRPDILLADEPTGNLDTRRSEEIGEILTRLNREFGLTIILVTHNPALAGIAKKTVALRDGVIENGPHE
jgi:putative ABC transport system ATP-binding protein